MALFASTSPSYLILQSRDGANAYMAEGYRTRVAAFVSELSGLKERLAARGYTLIGSEPMKLTIAARDYGYTGDELAELLLEQGIVCEFSDPDYMVMMFTPEIGMSDLERVEKALLSIGRREKIQVQAPALPGAERVLSIREAMFAPSEERPVEACCGRILASANVSCPPAIPIVVCGERIGEEAIACFKYYGITTCRIIRE